jgi:hypothetical protein
MFQIDVESLQVCFPKHSPPTPPSYYSLIENEIGFDDVFLKQQYIINMNEQDTLYEICVDK